MSITHNRKCKICNKAIEMHIGGFNNYARRGLCEECHKNIKTKVCSMCKKEKPVEEFKLVGFAKDKRFCYCDPCRKKNNKEVWKRYKKEPARKVGEIDADLANDLTKIKW